MVSTAQHLTDLATELVARGHQVTVITGNRGYDDPSLRFPKEELWKGIKIIRIPALVSGKGPKWRRALNFGSFLVACALRLSFLPRFDAVIALTSPPLISVLGALFAQLRGGEFFFWVMDLNPDEAIAAGWLERDSLFARLLDRNLRYSLRRAARVIALDRFMKDRLLSKGACAEQVVVLPPWSHDDAIEYDAVRRDEFRERHKLTEKFVVMYSGNHSPCHPLDTVLEAARRLEGNEKIAFCFVGGGSEKIKVRTFAARHSLKNIVCLPYQPLADLAGSLSAADLHTVVMGDDFTGIVHPCKIYNILRIGTALLYVGPEKSHITEVMAEAGDGAVYSARHGDVESVVEHIRQAELSGFVSQPHPPLANQFSKGLLLPQLIEIVESIPATEPLQARPVPSNNPTLLS